MALDSDLMELDSLGIFPRLGESSDEYVSRGWKVVQHSDCKNPLDYVAPILEFCEWKNVAAADRSLVEEAAARLGRQFCCGMDWIDVYYAETDFPAERSTLGFSLANKKSIEGGIERQIPPCVVLNRRSIIPHMPVLLHELAHSARELSDVNPHRGKDYVGDYEELVADGAGNLWNKLVHLRLLPSKALPEYLCARCSIKKTFGRMADYVMIRTSYEEINVLFLKQKLAGDDLRRYICKTAEEKSAGMQYLKYEIMKERLGL